MLGISNIRPPFMIAALLLVHAVSAVSALAAESTGVIARLNGQPIRAAEVRRVVEPMLKARPADAAAEKVLRAEALQAVIDRRLVQDYLDRRGLGARRQEVRLAVRRFEEQLKPQGISLADYLEKAGIDEADLERRFAWQLGWERYLKQYLTDENLAKFFERHRRDFDGTEVRVAHVLWSVKPGDGRDAWDGAVQRAETVRQEIASGALSFESAAEKHSQAPTAKWGGDIGFITRRKTMPEEFSAAAFALEAGEISQPVITPFGVHLIKCTEIKPGARGLAEVRGELEQAAGRYLFRWIAERERPRATIEYTEGVPHFKPGTKTLAD
jgi:parvulin-like peptidyl-prolyl isomerase